MRAYAIKQGLFDNNSKVHHLATIYSDDFDKQVDYGMRKTLKTKRENILDSWLSGFVAQSVRGTLKILTTCDNNAVRVDRIVNRDNLTIGEAKKHIFEREEKNTTKWRRMYKQEWQKWVIEKKVLSPSKPVWYWYPELYDLTIDTYKYSKEQTLKLALNALGFKGKVSTTKQSALHSNFK